MIQEERKQVTVIAEDDVNANQIFLVSAVIAAKLDSLCSLPAPVCDFKVEISSMREKYP